MNKHRHRKHKNNKCDNPIIGSLSIADFYFQLPNNSVIIPIGKDILFPKNGPSFGTDIIRINDFSFNLVSIGIYQILYDISITEPGQLIITLNNKELDYTVFGRSTGTSQLSGMCLVETLTTNSVLTIRNPSNNLTILTLSALAGGVNPTSAHLIISRIK